MCSRKEPSEFDAAEQEFLRAQDVCKTKVLQAASTNAGIRCLAAAVRQEQHQRLKQCIGACQNQQRLPTNHQRKVGLHIQL